MSIKITIDKLSEFVWLERVIQGGCMNLGRDTVGMFDKVGIPTKQNIQYELSDSFEDDINPRYKEYYEKLEKEDRESRERFRKALEEVSNIAKEDL